MIGPLLQEGGHGLALGSGVEGPLAGARAGPGGGPPRRHPRPIRNRYRGSFSTRTNSERCIANDAVTGPDASAMSTTVALIVPVGRASGSYTWAATARPNSSTVPKWWNNVAGPTPARRAISRVPMAVTSAATSNSASAPVAASTRRLRVASARSFTMRAWGGYVAPEPAQERWCTSCSAWTGVSMPS